jgi:hypothetical protein
MSILAATQPLGACTGRRDFLRHPRQRAGVKRRLARLCIDLTCFHAP